MAARGRGRVDAVTISNPTPYPAMVDLRGADWNGWLRLGRVQSQCERAIDHVLDAGDQWTFRFSHADHDEQVTLSRAALQQHTWQVNVPSSFADRLQELGVDPPDMPQ
jgi:hypothetical protein